MSIDDLATELLPISATISSVENLYIGLKLFDDSPSTTLAREFPVNEVVVATKDCPGL